jgi:hypothetical protein
MIPQLTASMRTILKKLAVVSALLGLTLALLPTLASADSVTVTPPRFEVVGSPGDVISEKVKVQNTGDTDVVYQVTAEDFKASDDAGSVDFVDPSTSNSTFSLARWMTFEPSKNSVPAGQEGIINFTIRIPKDGEPGGHYGSILVTRPGVSTPGGAAVNSTVASLILLRVTGATTEKLTLESFNPENGYQQRGPVNFNMRFKNEGNVHVAPTGTIVISNIFGKKVKEIPLTPTNVLPDASRVIKATWDETGMVGRYTASLVVSYGQSKQSIAASTSFIVFPVWLMVTIIVLIILLYLLIKNRKNFKRMINNLTRE